MTLAELEAACVKAGVRPTNVKERLCLVAAFHKHKLEAVLYVEDAGCAVDLYKDGRYCAVPVCPRGSSLEVALADVREWLEGGK